MKTRIYRSDENNLRNNYKVYRCGYCELQYLLKFYEPIYYNAGTYGWNYDVYKINDIYIVTGCRPMKKCVEINHDLARKYNEKARKNDNIDELIKEFLKELKGDEE